MNQRWHNSLLVLILLILSPVVLILLYLHPSTDDYCLSSFVRDQGWAWTQHFVYTQWGGRFTSTFFLSLDPLVYGSLWGYRFMSLLLMTLMGVAIYRSVDLVFIPNEKRIQKVVVSLFLFLFLFLLQPSAVEAWYWYASSYTYQLSLVLLLLVVPSLLRYALKSEEVKFPALAFLIFSLNMAMNEAIMVIQVLLFCVFVFLLYKRKARFSISYLPWMLLLVTVLLVTVLAPGNFNRGEGMLVRISPWLAGWLALKHWLGYVQYWLLIGIPAAFLLRIYTLGVLKSEVFALIHMKVKAGMVALFLMLSGLPVFTVYIVANYDPPERIMNISAFFFLIAILILVFAAPTPVRSLKLWYMVLLTLMLVMGAVKPNAWTRLTEDLLSGRASRYDKEMQRREETLKTCEEDCLLLPIRNKPLTIFYRELNEEPGKWPNDCYAEYYKKHSIGLRRDINRSSCDDH